MSFEIITKLGGVPTIRVTGNDIKQAMELSGFLVDLPAACPMCGSAVAFYHRKTPNSGDDYYGLRCRPENASAQTHECSFGQYKEKGLGFFYKKNWKNTWKPSDDRDEDEPRARGANQPQNQRPAQPSRHGGGEFEG